MDHTWEGLCRETLQVEPCYHPILDSDPYERTFIEAENDLEALASRDHPSLALH